jgi:hypothetical protein
MGGGVMAKVYGYLAAEGVAGLGSLGKRGII